MNIRTVTTGALCAAAVALIYGLALFGSWLGGSGALDLPGLNIRKVSFDSLPGWRGDAQGEALPAFLRSCERIRQGERDAKLGSSIRSKKLEDLFGTAEAWIDVCSAASKIDGKDDAATRRFFETWFAPVQIFESSRRQGLLTGYYEPQLEGSRKRSPTFDVALLRPPSDLIQVDLGDFREDLKGERVGGRVVGSRLRPYETRAQIGAGALDPKELALVWVNDAVDAFFLHIQGSGRVVMQDGSVMRVGYASQNGRPYTAIGRVLVDRGELELENVSMQSIRAWLDDHPFEASDVMDANESFIFFQEIPVENSLLGPLGAQSVPLTPRRSVAVDRRYYALGLPIWVDVTTSAFNPSADPESLATLAIAQDTGGAIRGPQRGDYFLGFGDERGEIAGRMRAEGAFYALVLRALADENL